MKKMLVFFIVCLTQSCAQMDYHSFLAEEKAKMIERCIKEGNNSVNCEIEATENISAFREKIEDNE